MIDCEQYRHGSAGLADERMLAQAGLYSAQSGLYLGHSLTSNRELRSDQQAALLLVGGARSFKSNHIIRWLVDGHYNDHIMNMDWKAQNGPIAQLQVLQGRRNIYINPRNRGGVPSHRLNPVSYMRGDSPTLIPDCKLFAQNMLPFSGSTNGQIFEATGQRWIEAIAVVLARINGAATLPIMADLSGQVGQLSDYWLGFEGHMASMADPFIQTVVEELKAARESNNPNTGGASGAKVEIAKAFSSLSDPQLREAVSPPYDFDFADMNKPDAPPHFVSVMEAQDYAQTSAPVIRSIYTCNVIYKRRAVGTSRRQLWVLDEIGSIGSWPMAVDLATYGAGDGIRPVFITQSYAQLSRLAPQAEKIIPNSCGTQIYKGIRDSYEARRISAMLGTQTIEVEDFHTNERARLENEQAVLQVLSGQIDPVQAGFEMAQRDSMLNHQTKAPRPVMTPDEITNMKNGQALVFMPGVLERPALVHVPNYWQCRQLTGRFMRDPYISPRGKVEVSTRLGQRFKPIITEPVPSALADWPQYRSGYWSYVKGYRPL